jgi:heme a synthase
MAQPFSAPTGPRPLALARWLWTMAVLLLAIVVVGGITRLTESGVSITEWKPVSGILPPLDGAEWQAQFEAYRQTPQYIQVNGPAGMTLADYKAIFFWEWLHRLLARFIVGVAFTVPLVWFWLRGAIPTGYKGRLVALLALGGVQGLVGWWMVKSGIVNDVKVSHLRLAVHLLLPLAILAATVWTALDLEATARGEPRSRLTWLGGTMLAMLFVQLGLGALVAGLRAGYVASDWPLMTGRLVPAGIDWSQGPGHAVLYDPFLIHFLHRWWAWLVVAALVLLARRIRATARRASVAIHSAFGAQVLLGIATVMSGMSLWLAALHQLVGALLLAVTTWGIHCIGRQSS